MASSGAPAIAVALTAMPLLPERPTAPWVPSFPAVPPARPGRAGRWVRRRLPLAPSPSPPLPRPRHFRQCPRLRQGRRRAACAADTHQLPAGSARTACGAGRQRRRRRRRRAARRTAVAAGGTCCGAVPTGTAVAEPSAASAAVGVGFGARAPSPIAYVRVIVLMTPLTRCPTSLLIQASAAVCSGLGRPCRRRQPGDPGAAVARDVVAAAREPIAPASGCGRGVRRTGVEVRRGPRPRPRQSRRPGPPTPHPRRMRWPRRFPGQPPKPPTRPTHVDVHAFCQWTAPPCRTVSAPPVPA